MAVTLRYSARGKPNQIYYLKSELVGILDTLQRVARAADSERTLVECMHAKPPMAEQVPVYKDDPIEVQSATLAFRAALRRDHRNKPQTKFSDEQNSENPQRPYQWYINPIYSFEGSVGLLGSQSGGDKKIAVEIARVKREGEIKIDYTDGSSELSLTVTHQEDSELSNQVLAIVSSSFETAGRKGIDIHLSRE